MLLSKKWLFLSPYSQLPKYEIPLIELQAGAVFDRSKRKVMKSRRIIRSIVLGCVAADNQVVMKA